MIDWKRRQRETEEKQNITPRKPPPLRACRMRELEGENGRIVRRYVEAIEDATRDAKGGKPTQKQINDRYHD